METFLLAAVLLAPPEKKIEPGVRSDTEQLQQHPREMREQQRQDTQIRDRETPRLRERERGRVDLSRIDLFLEEISAVAASPWWLGSDQAFIDGGGLQRPTAFGGQGDLNTRVLVNLRVPPDAIVFFDNARTQQTGTVRSFISPQVGRGDHTYVIRAICRGPEGEPIEKVTRLTVHAGDLLNVNILAAPTQLRKEQER